MAEEQNEGVAVQAQGVIPGGVWKATVRSSTPWVLGTVIWSGAWYYLKPDSKFLPLGIVSIILGFLLGRATNGSLLQQKDQEVARRDAELARMSDSKDELVRQILKRPGSSDPKKGKRK